MPRLASLIFALLLIAFPAHADDAATTTVATLTAEANAARTAGQLERAIEIAERAVDLAPDDIPANIALAEALGEWLDQNRSMKALSRARQMRKILEKIRLAEPDKVNLRVNEIQFYIQAPGVAGGSKKKARTLIDELEALDPVLGQEQRLSLALAEKDEAGVRAAYEKLIEIAPEAEKYRLQFGSLLFFQQGDYDGAEAVLSPLEQSADEKTRLSQAMLRAIMRLNANRDLETGLTLVDQYIAGLEAGAVIENLPPLEGAYGVRGALLKLLGRTDEARAAYEKALEIAPDNKSLREALESL